MSVSETNDGPEQSPEEWASAYAGRRGTYEDFARRLQDLLVDLLKAEAVDVIQVESRAKTVASFAEKIRRKGGAGPDPLTSTTDLVGLRVITYYIDDVDRVGQMLEREFEIDVDNSMDKAKGLASDQFGYRSAHYVVRLTQARAQLAEWRTFSGLSAEVQVRTSLQHAWAAVSHKLEYKAVEEAPTSQKRRLIRLSALFEIADDQFAALRDERESTFAAYTEEVTRGRLTDVPIDTSSLAAYWSLSDKGIRLRAALKSVGFKLEEEVPVERDRLVRDRADLVKTLRDCGFDTLADLDNYLLVVQRLVPLMKALREGDGDVEVEDAIAPTTVSMEDALTQLVICDMDKAGSLGKSVYEFWVSDYFEAARAAAISSGFVPWAQEDGGTSAGVGA